MTKIVYNACYGGFGLSQQAMRRYHKIAGKPIELVTQHNLCRHDPVLVQVVEDLGSRANGAFAELKIRDIPSGSRYRIDEYDGNERVMTPEDYEWVIAP